MSLREELENQERKELEQKIAIAAKTAKTLANSKYISSQGATKYTPQFGAFNMPRY